MEKWKAFGFTTVSGEESWVLRSGAGMGEVVSAGGFGVFRFVLDGGDSL